MADVLDSNNNNNNSSNNNSSTSSTSSNSTVRTASVIAPSCALDAASRIALDGVSVSRVLQAMLEVRGVPRRTVCAVVEMLRLLLASHGLYSKPGRGIKRHHVVHVLMQVLRERQRLAPDDAQPPQWHEQWHEQQAMVQQYRPVAGVGQADGQSDDGTEAAGDDEEDDDEEEEEDDDDDDVLERQPSIPPVFEAVSSDALFRNVLAFLSSGAGAQLFADERGDALRTACWREAAGTCGRWQQQLQSLGLTTASLCQLVMQRGWEEASDQETAIATAVKDIACDHAAAAGDEEVSSPAAAVADNSSSSKKWDGEKGGSHGTGDLNVSSTIVRFALSGDSESSAAWQAQLFLHARLPSYMTRLSAALREEAGHTGLVRCFVGEERFADAFEPPKQHPTNSTDAGVRFVLWRPVSRRALVPVLQPLWQELEHFRRQGVCMAVALGGAAVFCDVQTAESTWTDARVTQAVRAFVASGERTLALPPQLTAFQRKLVHGICEKLQDVSSRSEGQGSLRHIVLSKTK